jgi:hypothetical protein
MNASSVFRALFTLLLVATGALWSVPAAAQKAPGWTGQYVTDYQGQPGELSLVALGSFLGGTFVSGGDQYTISGRIKKGAATGVVMDAAYQSMPFTARIGPSGPVFTVKVRDANGIEAPIVLTFERPEVAAARRAAEEARAASSGAAAGGGRGSVDARLVGAWRATEAGRSGDFSWASDSFIRFAADGSCADGGGRTFAGSGSVSGGTGAGAITACQWSARDRVLHIRSAGGGWRQVARYAVHEDGSAMMWTYADGSKLIWKRQ